MFLKIKNKRNKLAVITKENIKDVKIIYCIEDFPDVRNSKVTCYKGSYYKIRRYPGANYIRIRDSNTPWAYYRLEDLEKYFRGVMINRRKPKNKEENVKGTNKVQESL